MADDHRALHALGRGLAARHGPVLLAIAVGIGSQYLPPRVPRAIAGFSRLNLVAQAAVLAVALMVTQALGPQDVAPFIYFQF